MSLTGGFTEMSRLTLWRWMKVPTAALSGVTVLGCMWDRFDDLRSDAPVVELEKPSDISGNFGSMLTKLAGDDVALVYVAGTPTSPAAVFAIGRSETPTPEAIDTSHCDNANPERSCAIARQAAGLRTWQRSGDEKENCFVSGVGRIDSREGLFTRCGDNSIFVIPLPDDVREDLVGPLRSGAEPADVWLASDSSEEPALVAAAPDHQRAWYYAPGSTVPIDLDPPAEPGQSFGSSLSVVQAGADRLVVVAAPEEDQLWLFRVRAEVAESLGCVGGLAGLGRTMAAGDVDGDGVEDFAVAANDSVTVFSGAALAGLPHVQGQTDVACSLAALPEESLVTSFTCGSGSDTGSCAKSRFGASLTIGDFNGDDDAEIAVGAPAMTAREIEGAGAVLLYDNEGNLIGTSIASEAEPQAGYGAAIVSLPQESRDILVVGAPGANKTRVVYCATVTDGKTSPRCHGQP